MSFNLFIPDTDLVKNSNINLAMSELGFETYNDFYNWSITDKEKFIDYSIKKIGIQFEIPYSSAINLNLDNQKVDWFKGSKLNIVESCFNSDPKKIALIFKSENSELVKLTYGELYDLVMQVKTGLINAKLNLGERCVIYMPMSLTSVVLYLALIAAGMVVVLVPDSFSYLELKKRIKIVDAKYVFACDEYVYNQKIIDLSKKIEQLKGLKLYTASAKDCVGKQFGFKQFLSNSDVLFKYEYADPNSFISILFSSGTTKDPKAIPWNHITPLKCALDGFYHLDIHANDIVTWTTGMGWMMAPWLIFATFINSATLAIYQGSYQNDDYGQFVQDAKVSVLGVIPSLVKLWKNSNLMEKFDWNIRVFASTGEPSSSDDYLYLQSLSNFKAPIIEYCGGTEIGGAYITNTVVEPSLVSAFSTATLGTELCFVEHGELREALIVVPAIGLSDKLLNYDHEKEYFDKNADLIPGKKLRKHGDAYELININQDHYYKSRGRIDDTFNLNGIKVSAVEIEQIILQHKKILDLAAVSFSNNGPEQLVIFYCSKENLDEDVLLVELQKLISQNLNPLFRISKLVKIDELPRTASNKLMRKELRKLI